MELSRRKSDILLTTSGSLTKAHLTDQTHKLKFYIKDKENEIDILRIGISYKYNFRGLITKDIKISQETVVELYLRIMELI